MASGLSHRAQAPAMLGGGDMSQAGIANSEDTLIARWARAWSTQDASLFLSLFADDAHYCDVALEKGFLRRDVRNLPGLQDGNRTLRRDRGSGGRRMGHVWHLSGRVVWRATDRKGVPGPRVLFHAHPRRADRRTQGLLESGGV